MSPTIIIAIGEVAAPVILMVLSKKFGMGICVRKRAMPMRAAIIVGLFKTVKMLIFVASLFTCL